MQANHTRFEYGPSTTDGILPETELQDAPEPEETAAALGERKQNPAETRQQILEGTEAAICSLQQMVAEGTTNTSRFRNQLLRLQKSYYITDRLSEAEATKQREQNAAAIASAPGLLSSLCSLAYDAFAAERETRFLEPDGATKRQQPLNLLGYVVTLCQNYSDVSVPFSLELSLCEPAMRLCADMQREWAEVHLDGGLNDEVNKRLRQTLALVYNLLFKGENEIFFNLRDFNFVETAQPYLKSKHAHFRFTSFLVLVFSCNEEEASKLLIHETSLASYLVANLNSAHKNNDRRSNGFHVVELAKCALQFTKNEQNKRLLVNSEILPVLSMMLETQSPQRRDEVSAALRILLSLSFDSHCCSAIREQCGPELRTLRRQPDWRGDRDLAGIQFKMEGTFTTDGFEEQQRGPPKSPSPTPPAPAPSAAPPGNLTATREFEPLPQVPPPPPAPPSSGKGPGHLMISYHQHSSSSLVRWICTELVGQRFKVWVDYEQMQGSTLECMASAVEGSSAVLMCVCKGYKESDFCRMEAEYAVNRKKLIVPLLVESKYKADGWLGLVMGSKLYYNFSGAEGKSRTDAFEALINFLNQQTRQLPPAADNGIPGGVPEVEQPVVPVRAQPTGFRTPGYADWSADEVTKWLLENRLPSHLEPYRLEGRHLRFLTRLKGQAPEAFYRLLQKSLKLSLFHELYEFVDALDRL